MPTNSDLLHQYITGEKPAAKSGKETAAAMDAMPKSVNAGNAKVSVADLAAHDKHYHDGHYEGGKCDFRTKNGIPTTAGKNKVVKRAAAPAATPKDTTVQGEGIGIFYRDPLALGAKQEMKVGDRVRAKGALGEYVIIGADGKGNITLMDADTDGTASFVTDGSDLVCIQPTTVDPAKNPITGKKNAESAQDYLDAVEKDKKKSEAKKAEDKAKEKAEKIKALQDLHDEYNKWFENSDKSDPSAWLAEDKKWTDKMNAAMKGLVIGKDIQWDADKRNWYSIADGQKKSDAAAKNGGEELVLTEDKAMSDSSGSWKHGKYKDYEVSVANLGEGRFAGYIDIPEVHPLGNYDFENRDTSQFYKIADVPGGITSAGVGRFGWDYENGATDYGDFASLSDEDKEKRVAEDAKKIIDAIEAKRADILKKRVERKETPEFLRFIENEEHQQSFEDETDYVARGKIQPYTDEYLDWCYDYLYGDEPLV